MVNASKLSLTSIPNAVVNPNIYTPSPAKHVITLSTHLTRARGYIGEAIETLESSTHCSLDAVAVIL